MKKLSRDEITPSNAVLHIVDEILESAPEGLLPVAVAETSAPAVLANTLRSVQRLGQIPRGKAQAETTILATIEGSRGETHTIKLGRDGVVYCSCKAWKFQRLPPSRRTCKHINALAGIS